jgi:TolB-like protein
MFTDIVGYTSLMGKDEYRAFEVLQKNREIHTKLIKKHHGTLIKEIGDGILISFNSSVDAVYCAIEIQKESIKQEIPLKIGIHEGDMVFDRDDVYGDGVNIASRLQDITETGAITISDVVHRNIKNKPGVYTAYIGEKSLKNVDGPVKAFVVSDIAISDTIKPFKKASKTRNIIPFMIFFALLCVIVILIFIWSKLGEKQPEREISNTILPAKSIAVLPFDNLSNDEDQEIMCIGLTEEIIFQLSKIRSFHKVCSRTSVMAFRDKGEKTLSEIAEILDVNIILEGSFRQSGEQIRITAQLIDATSDKHIWAEIYNIQSGDILEIQSNIAKEVSTALNIILTPDEERRVDHQPTKNMEAYELWIRGRQEMRNAYWAKPGNKHAKLAMKLFDQALELDPDYPDALAAKGEVFSFLKERDFDSTIYYCNKAIELNPELFLAYWIRGFAYQQLKEYDFALNDYIKTVELAPNFPDGAYGSITHIYFYIKHDYLGGLKFIRKYFQEAPEGAWHFYTDIGDYAKAKEYAMKVIGYGNYFYGIHFYSYLLAVEGKNQKALIFIDSICGEDDRFPVRCYIEKWYHYLHLKEFKRAKKYYDLLVNNGRRIAQYDSARLAYMYKELGKDDLAIETLNRLRGSLENMLKENREDSKAYALNLLPSVHALLNNKEEALKYLAEYAKVGFIGGEQDFIKYSPVYDNIRDDPEFIAIIKREQDNKAAIRAKVREMEEQGELEF